MDISSDSLSPEQELAFIRKIINESREAMTEDGIPYITWGVSVAIGMLLTYFEALLNINLYAGYAWIVLILGALSLTFWYISRNKREKKPETFGDKLQGAIWGICGSAIGFVVIMFASAGSPSPSQDLLNAIFICAFSSIILGIAYFLSGIVLQIRWLRNLGFVWWLGCLAMILTHSIHALAVYAGMLILFQVLPGLILNRNYRRTLLIVK